MSRDNGKKDSISISVHTIFVIAIMLILLIKFS